MTNYEELIYTRDYARWLPEENRRERWVETVNRYADFFDPRVPNHLKGEYELAINHIRSRTVMPSMRALWSAGPALENDNIAGYNCAYTVIDSVEAFAEIIYILMNGAGVGFSTERQYISQLPEVPTLTDLAVTIEFGDSKLGWAQGYLDFMKQLYLGNICKYDLTMIRPKGAPLKTFGGRASGPEPLQQLLQFTKKVFKQAQGRKLNSLECYDIVCYIADCVVSGGVRRSATINLSNLSDTRMRRAKDGQFYLENPQRSLSNNSVCYTEKPDMGIFMEEWMSLMKSGTGERGIFNREAAIKQAKFLGREKYDFGTNPCGEIILRPRQFCNLTEVVVKPWDSWQTLAEKVRCAVRLGVIQSTLTEFRFLRDDWAANCEEERLLGVSLTGIMDHPTLSSDTKMACYQLDLIRAEAHKEARKWAKALNINTPKAITCVKPSGTVSQLVGSSSGMHARHSRYYIRRIRVNSTDPVAHLLRDSGVPMHPEVGQTLDNCTTVVFDFPVVSPHGSVYRGQRTALEQLDHWLMFKKHWTDHNPSFTVYVKDAEWMAVGAWVYAHWDEVGGISFLPYDGGVYQLAPYEEIDKETYDKLNANFPVIPFENLSRYEGEDTTSGSMTYACVGDKCNI